jgi:hypothetical protein
MRNLLSLWCACLQALDNGHAAAAPLPAVPTAPSKPPVDLLGDDLLGGGAAPAAAGAPAAPAAGKHGSNMPVRSVAQKEALSARRSDIDGHCSARRLPVLHFLAHEWEKAALSSLSRMYNWHIGHYMPARTGDLQGVYYSHAICRSG